MESGEWYAQKRASESRWTKGLLTALCMTFSIAAPVLWLMLWDWVDDTGSGPAGPTSGERSGPSQQAEAEHEASTYLVDWTDADGHGPA
jgi:hypothetical protein